MTKEEFLAKRKVDWLTQERRDFIGAYTETWESGGWIEEWEAQERALRAQWIVEYPDGTDDDWEEWLNRQLLIWQAERREALREEAQRKWSEREAEYERRWVQYVKDTGENTHSEE